MTYTNFKVKTGKDLANIFYNVPVVMQPFKNEGIAVGKIEIEVSVDDMVFFTEELRFTGASPVKPFGKIDLVNMGEGQYSYKVKESIIRFTKDRFEAEEVGRYEETGTFFIGEQYPAIPFSRNTSLNKVETEY